jgi:hypothetical protein
MVLWCQRQPNPTVPSSRVEVASCAEARVPYFSQPEAGWTSSLAASELAWAEPVSMAQPELVERGARAQGRASQPVLA